MFANRKGDNVDINDIPNTKQYKELIMHYEAGLNLALNIINVLLKEREFYTGEKITDHIKSRIKTFASATKKLKKKGYAIDCANIEKHVHDMIGIRIICPLLNDVYKVVKMIRKNDVMTILEEKDYITNPKKSGYTSYHLLVRIPVSFLNKTKDIELEIQVRTLAQDFWASEEHMISYKFDGLVPDEIKNELKTIAEDMTRLDNKMVELSEFMKDYKEKEEDY